MSKRKTVKKGIQHDRERNCYYVNFSLGSDATGGRTRWAETFSTLKEAEVAQAEFLAKKKAGKIKNVIKKDSLQEYLIYWLDVVKKRECGESTLYGYQNIVNNHIIPKLGDVKMQKLNASHINKYFLHLSEEKKLSSNTIKKHYNLLKDAMQNAKREKKIFENVMDNVTPITSIQTEIEILTKQETKDLLKKVKGHSLEVPVYLATLLGLRRGEINGLTWDDVDFLNNTISITKSRTQVGKEVVVGPTKNVTSNRILAMSPVLKKVLEAEKNRQKENKKIFGEAWGVGTNEDNTNTIGYAFCKPNGTLYRPNYQSNYFPKFLKRNSLRNVKFHSLRHTFASIALEAGVNIFEVSKMLGHSNTNTTTKIYAKLYDKTNQAAVNKISDALL